MAFGCFAPRAHSRNDSTEHREARDFKVANARGFSAGAYDAQTFYTHLDIMLNSLLAKPDASSPQAALVGGVPKFRAVFVSV